MTEKLGTSLIHLIGNQAPWRSEHCGRENCWPCKTKTGSCKAHNIVYSITCVACKSQGVNKIYWGESHRSAWDRAADHWKALETGDTGYAVAKHQQIDHSGQDHNFAFKVHQSFKSSLARQIMEAIMIDQEDPTAKLNSRAEWGLNSIPRLVVHQDLPEGQENSQQGQNGQSQNTASMTPFLY